jgi:hypothetical protein
MTTKPTFRWFSAGELIAAAGGDPWVIEDQLHSGDAGAINDLANAFHQAGSHVREADEQFNKAKEQFKSAYSRKNGSEHPINDAAEVQRMSTQLTGHPEQLSAIGASLEQTAAALATAQRDAVAEIGELDAALHSIDAELSAAGPQLPLVLETLLDEAKGQTKMSLGTLENIQGAYIDQLHGAETALMNSGYVSDALAAADAVPGNSSQEAAKQYKDSGQLAKDQQTVADAKKLDPSNLQHMPGVAEAQRRLDDYAAVTDPDNKDASHIWYKHGAEREEAQHLAGERLNDWNVATSTGPVAKDPILGGDMRDRAKARLTMQRQLEDAQLPWSQLPMSADDATKLMDNLEVRDRAAALTRLQEQLVGAGVSPSGAKSITDAYARGIVPALSEDQKLAWKAGGAVSEVTSRGYDTLTEMEKQLHLDEADVKVMKGLGKTFGHASNALEWGMTLYEISSGEKTPVQGLMGIGGSMAGAWALGEPAATLGFAIGGPPGAFILGAPAAVVGGLGGEYAADKVYAYLTGKP